MRQLPARRCVCVGFLTLATKSVLVVDWTEKTFFDGVRAVPAAAYAIVDGDGIRVERYWEPVLSEDGSGDPAEFRAVFERAVERRLVADVPVGIWQRFKQQGVRVPDPQRDLHIRSGADRAPLQATG